MELQWPLILFTSFIAWSAGTFAAQGIYALKKEARPAQMPALIVSVVLLVIGGISVFFHLEHWERIFNGFGHLTSGITQELICIIIMLVVMVVYFAMLRRSEDGTVPAWVAVLAIVSAIALVVIMGHSYMMESRPAWNNVFGIASLLGAACALGPATVAFLDKGGEEASSLSGPLNIVGSVLALLGIAGFGLGASSASSSITQVDYTFDPTVPEAGLPDFSNMALTDGSNMGMFVFAVVLAALAVVFAFLGKKGGNWKLFGLLIVICVFVAAILLRIVFYQMGGSVFGYY